MYMKLSFYNKKLCQGYFNETVLDNHHEANIDEECVWADIIRSFYSIIFIISISNIEFE